MDTKRNSNARSLAAPNKYVQGPGLFDELRRFTDLYGGKPVFVIDAFIFDLFAERISTQYGEDSQPQVLSQRGEITDASISLLKQSLSAFECGVLVAVGGGKTIDTVKIVAHELGLPGIVVPTSASSDAPTSSLGVVYKESGEHSHEVFLPSNPTLVLVDTQVIADAPARLLVAGMGDALATFFEATANERNYSVNVVTEELGLHFGGTLAARHLARLCYDTLIQDGIAAKTAVELGVVTEALENIVEANTLLSGIGFESNGTAAAHAINDGLTVLPAGVKLLHGERVAFGVLCELVMENAPRALQEEVLEFCCSVGLPVTFADMGIHDLDEDDLTKVVNAAYDNVIHAEPFVVTKDLIKAAILVADAQGRTYRRERQSLRLSTDEKNPMKGL